jgi:hypothetical protein
MWTMSTAIEIQGRYLAMPANGRRPGQDRRPMREKNSISFVTKKFS